MQNIEQGDPQFVDATKFDFRLQRRSPAIDAGVAEHAPAIDLEGTPRPQGDSVDVGAHERSR